MTEEEFVEIFGKYDLENLTHMSDQNINALLQFYYERTGEFLARHLTLMQKIHFIAFMTNACENLPNINPILKRTVESCRGIGSLLNKPYQELDKMAIFFEEICEIESENLSRKEGGQ